MDRTFTRRLWLVAGVGLLALTMAGLPSAALHAADEAPAQGWVGVDIDEVPDDVREALKLPADSGVVINEVHADTAAEKAGIKAGDVVTAIEGKPAPNVQGFVELIASKKAGDVLEFTISREKKEMKIKVTLGKKPE